VAYIKVFVVFMIDKGLEFDYDIGSVHRQLGPEFIKADRAITVSD